MAAGIIPTRANFDTQLGQHARNILAELQWWADTNAWIAGVAGGFAGLKDTTASGIFGAQAYTDVPGGSGDATRVFAGAADMAKLNALLRGTQASPYTVTDLTANVKFLTAFP